ncbi:MAG: FGGY family carbohydrate kinase [Flavobacteriales bacterium]
MPKKSGRLKPRYRPKTILKADLKGKYITDIGITNQRETTIIWDRSKGSIYNVIVWQDWCTVDHCDLLKEQGLVKKSGKRRD